MLCTVATVPNEADANLTAAAPDLHDIITRFVAWLERADGDDDCLYLNGEDGPDAWDDVRALALEARTALAKAGAKS